MRASATAATRGGPQARSARWPCGESGSISPWAMPHAQASVASEASSRSDAANATASSADAVSQANESVAALHAASVAPWASARCVSARARSR